MCDNGNMPNRSSARKPRDVNLLAAAIVNEATGDVPPGEPDERDPVLVMLAASPVDNEPVTDDDRRRIEEGWQAYRDGRVVSAQTDPLPH